MVTPDIQVLIQQEASYFFIETSCYEEVAQDEHDVHHGIAEMEWTHDIGNSEVVLMI